MSDDIIIRSSSPATPPTQSPATQPQQQQTQSQSSSAAATSNFQIPTLVKEKFPDLVELIKSTESMSDEEREYWFQILPIMTEEQIIKLRNILISEKEQLQKLDQEYEDELNKLNEKHMIEWKEFESKEKRKALVTAESSEEVKEKKLEEDLLSQLNQL